MDKLPPHDLNAEMCIIGCCVTTPKESLPEAQSVILSELYFYDARCQEAWKFLNQMEMSKIDMVTVSQKAKILLSFFNECQDLVFSAANLSAWIEIVVEQYLLRKLIAVSTNAVRDAYETTNPIALIDVVEREILSIRRTSSTGQEVGVKELVHQSINRIESLWERKGAISGISTGIHDLDRKTDGLHGGDLVVVAAFPSVGKTSLLMNIVENVVLEQKLPVGIFTYEMSGVSLVTRFICSHARVNLRNIRDGIICETDFPKITNSASRISNAPIYFEHNGDLNLMQLRAKARRWKQQYGIKMIGVDYIQKVKPSGSNKGDNREREVSAISDGLKSLALELDVPVIALSQLNDDGKLRESRTIGQDADGVWMLERDDSKSTEEADFVDLWLRKQRNEERDVCVNLTFLKKITRFQQRETRIIDDEDVPK